MKKSLLSVFLLSLLAFCGFSQSLTLSNSHGQIASNAVIIQAGTPDSSELVTHINVTNNGSATINVLCKKVELTPMLDSTEMTMCWAGGCYPASAYVSPNAQALEPGQTNTEFSGHYAQTAFHHFISGESVIRWVFFDRSNVNDSACVTIKYTTYPLGIEDTKLNQGALSGIYPNPASGEAHCSYSLPAGSQGTFVIRDVLGSSVQTQMLSANSGKVEIITTNLGNGIYFCSLLVDGKISQTKKLIVKH